MVGHGVVWLAVMETGVLRTGGKTGVVRTGVMVTDVTETGGMRTCVKELV